MRKLIWVLCIAAAFSGAAAADEGHHHEELTQEQLGTVHFPVSCTPDAQKTFEKGVALPGAPHIRVFCECVGVRTTPLFKVPFFITPDR